MKALRGNLKFSGALKSTVVAGLVVLAGGWFCCDSSRAEGTAAGANTTAAAKPPAAGAAAAPTGAQPPAAGQAAGVAPANPGVQQAVTGAASANPGVQPTAAAPAPTAPAPESGLWSDSALKNLRELDPKWAEAFEKMSLNPWKNQVLPRRMVELVNLGLNAACTNADGTRRAIRAALEASASRDEILTVLKMSSVLSTQSCSLGVPILFEEAKATGAKLAKRTSKPATPACDKLKAAGQWNADWDPLYELDPAWTEAFIAAGVGFNADKVLAPKDAELLSIAFDGAYTHLYAPGTRRHIKAALKAGATMEEIMEVLKLCASQGAQVANLAVPMLKEELDKRMSPAIAPPQPAAAASGNEPKAAAK